MSTDVAKAVPPLDGPAALAALPSSEAPGRTVLKYRPGLDVVRFAAALWVMLTHAGAVEGGGHAVAVFFVLSGYLIGGQLIKEKRQTATVRLPAFYFKRITRIWPAYFIILAGMMVLFIARRQDLVAGFYERAFGAFTYTYNIINDIKGNIHPTWVSFNQIWSLSIEEQFYLVVPLLVASIPVRWILPVTAILTIGFLFTLPLYAGLALGVFLAGMLDRHPVEYPSVRTSIVLGVAAIAVFALLFLVGQSAVSQTSWLTYLLAATVVFLAGRLSLPARLHAGLRYLGLMTYSYYLIHGLPIYFLGAAYRHVSRATQNPLWLNILCGLLGLPMSYLFVRWIEMPCLRRREKALKAKSPWIKRAPWIAWGLGAIGITGLVYIATRG